MRLPEYMIKYRDKKPTAYVLIGLMSKGRRHCGV